MKLNEINVVTQNVSTEAMETLIEFIVSNSYTEKGEYHKYLTDYYEAMAIATHFTDYDSNEFNSSELIDFILSDKYKEIKEKLGGVYQLLHEYVLAEIEYKNTPLRNADDFLATITKACRTINGVLDKIDLDALSNYDYNKIIKAVDEYNQKVDEENNK